MGSSIKDVRKNWPPCPKRSALIQFPPSFLCEKSEGICTKKCWVRIWRIFSPLTTKCPHWALPDCGRLLWTAPISRVNAASRKAFPSTKIYVIFYVTIQIQQNTWCSGATIPFPQRMGAWRNSTETHCLETKYFENLRIHCFKLLLTLWKIKMAI